MSLKLFWTRLVGARTDGSAKACAVDRDLDNPLHAPWTPRLGASDGGLVRNEPSGGDWYAKDKSERGNRRISALGRKYRTPADPSRRTVLGEEGCRQLVDTQRALSGRGVSSLHAEARVTTAPCLRSTR